MRRSHLCSLSNDELSPAELAVRVVLGVCARELVKSGVWLGALLSNAWPHAQQVLTHQRRK